MGNCWCGTNMTMSCTSLSLYTRPALQSLDGVQREPDFHLETRLKYGTFGIHIIKYTQIQYFLKIHLGVKSCFYNFKRDSKEGDRFISYFYSVSFCNFFFSEVKKKLKRFLSYYKSFFKFVICFITQKKKNS